MLGKTDLLLTLDLIDDCVRINSQEDLNLFYKKMSRDTGIQSMIAGHICPFTNSQQGHFFGIKPEWGKAYVDNNYSTIDPVFNLAVNTQKPVKWIEAYNNSGPISTDFISKAIDIGLVSGVSYSSKILSTTTLVSIGNGRDPLCRVQNEIVYRLLPHITEILVKPSTWNFQPLTRREKEVLKWCASGKSHWEISMLMSISERTVKFHMSNIFKKFNVTNKAQAVARFVSLGYV